MTAIVVVALGLAAVALAMDRIPPSIPANAAAAAIVTATPGEDGSGDGNCLDRASWGPGWADLCWQAWRLTDETDPSKDYYALTMYGSFQGVRWLVIRSDLAGQPAGGAFDGWPDGTYEGDCRNVTVQLMPLLQPLGNETVCGRTEGSADHVQWTQQVTWRCERCLFADATTRAIRLYTTVGVPEGTLPSWDLYADGGG